MKILLGLCVALMLASGASAQRYPTPLDTAMTFNGFIRMPSGMFLSSTNRGVFRTSNLTKPWTKVFKQDSSVIPTKGYPLSRSGNIAYIYQEKEPAVLWTSTDDGTNWLADTLKACSNTQIASFYIDEFGTKYALVNPHYVDSEATLILQKKSGGTWILDTFGLGIHYRQNYTTSLNLLISDNHGSLFVSSGTSSIFPPYYAATIYRRQISGDTWGLDTVGLNSRYSFGSFVVSNEGLVYGLSSTGLFVHAAGRWSSFPTSVSMLTIDSSNKFFGSSNGIVFSTDYGYSWNSAGYEGISIQGLMSDRDTTYAATTNAIYKITATPATIGAAFQQSSIDFGDVPLGDSVSRSLTITNDHTQSLIFTSVYADDHDFVSQHFNATIPPFDTLTVQVQFRPTTVGEHASQLQVLFDNDPASPYSIPVTGRGVAAGVADTKSLSSSLTNYPNPFSQATTLHFKLPKREHATIVVRDILGNEVSRLVDRMIDAGEQSVQWNASELPEGVYVVEMRVGETIARRFVTVMR